jgi:hypothetical protein
MRLLLLFVVGVVGFLTESAVAQNSPATTPVRVADTTEKLDGDNLIVKTKEDQAVTVTEQVRRNWIQHAVYGLRLILYIALSVTDTT